MRLTNRSAKISKTTWEEHRHAIEVLYLHEGRPLEGEDGVLDTMARLHQFQASKAQYEHRFRLWGFRKNIKRKDMDFIVDAKCKYARLGKDVLVELNGKSVDQRRIERETVRRGIIERSASPDIAPESVCLRDHLAPLQPTDYEAISSRPKLAPVSRLKKSEISRQCSQITIIPFQRTPIASHHSSHAPLTQWEEVAIRLRPFSWTITLGWKLFGEVMPFRGREQPSYPSKSISYAAMFYGSRTGTGIGIKTEDKSIPCRQQIIISAVLNDMTLPGVPHLQQIHQWLRSLGSTTLIRIFHALPSVAQDFFRERVFAEALKSGDKRTMEVMVGLGLRQREAIATGEDDGSGAMTPLQRALKYRQFDMAATHLSSMIRTATRKELDRLLRHVQETTHRSYEGYQHPRYHLEWRNLTCMLLSGGATPNVRCFTLALHEATDAGFEAIFSAIAGGLRSFLRSSLLEQCMWNSSRSSALLASSSSSTLLTSDNSSALLASRICDFVFRKKADWVPGKDASVELALAKSLRAALLMFRTTAATTLLEGCLQENIFLAYPNVNSALSGIVMDYCHRKRWDLVDIWIRRYDPPVKKEDSDEDQEILPRDAKLKHGLHIEDNSYAEAEWVDKLRQAVMENNTSFARKHRYSTWYRSRDWDHALEYAIELHHHEISVAIILFGCDDATNYHRFLTLLQHGSFGAISLLIETDIEWLSATMAASDEGNYTPLEDMLFRKQAFRADERLFLGLMQLHSSLERRIVLRALSYYAIHEEEFVLLDWLLDSGLDMESFACRTEGALDGKTLPSLLSLAAKQGDDYLVDFLLRRRTEVTGKELNENDSHTPTLLSPLGEAIIRRDREAVGMLLSHGANPNALVCQEKAWDSPGGSELHRATPLLAAIDMGDLTMVQQLLATGAASDHPPQQGLLRTPLQRASEVGNFEVVRHLLNYGVPVDSTPCYSGGTPLQLAAMSGHVGIATLLLEHGANVNHPPAEGHGLTAFEAAVSWGRCDMLFLLVHWKVDLGLVFESHGVTQYKRALLLAKRHGQMATRRFVEHLRPQKSKT